MTLLTLDQSSRISGYSVFIDNKLADFGKISLTDEDIGIRLVKLKQEILSLIDKYHPDKVVFEDIQLQNNVANNVQTFKILAEVYGVVSELLTERNIPYSTILAASWKSTLGIKGKTRAEQKRNAQQYIINTYQQCPIQDICDSICIGNAYIKQNTNNWSD